jgi:hypothetical protein
MIKELYYAVGLMPVEENDEKVGKKRNLSR